MVPFLTCNKSITVHRFEFVEFTSVNDSCDYLKLNVGSEDDIKQLLQQGLVLQMAHEPIEVTYLRRLKEQVMHVNLISFIRLHVEIYKI